MSAFLNMISVALMFLFVQNMVISCGYGVSEAMRASSRPRQYLTFALMISAYSTVSSLICRLFDLSSEIFALNNSWHTLIFCAVLAIIYLISVIVVTFVFPKKKKSRNKMGIAALNTLVLSVPLISRKMAYSLPQAIGAGIGAGLAFLIAVVLIHAGMKFLSDNEKIPKVFKGAPSLFFYVAMLSLAFTGLSGTTVFI